MTRVEVPERALTVVQPMAHMIHLGYKPIENRSRRPPAHIIGKTIAIHAGAKWSAEYAAAAARIVPAERDYLDSDQVQRSRITCVARVTGYVERGDEPGITCPYYRIHRADGRVEAHEQIPSDWRAWFVGPFGWTLADVVAIDGVDCSGALGLWKIPPPIRDVLHDQLRRWL